MRGSMYIAVFMLLLVIVAIGVAAAMVVLKRSRTLEEFREAVKEVIEKEKKVYSFDILPLPDPDDAVKPMPDPGGLTSESTRPRGIGSVYLAFLDEKGSIIKEKRGPLAWYSGEHRVKKFVANVSLSLDNCRNVEVYTMVRAEGKVIDIGYYSFTNRCAVRLEMDFDSVMRTLQNSYNVCRGDSCTLSFYLVFKRMGVTLAQSPEIAITVSRDRRVVALPETQDSMAIEFVIPSELTFTKSRVRVSVSNIPAEADALWIFVRANGKVLGCYRVYEESALSKRFLEAYRSRNIDRDALGCTLKVVDSLSSVDADILLSGISSGIARYIIGTRDHVDIDIQIEIDAVKRVGGTWRRVAYFLSKPYSHELRVDPGDVNAELHYLGASVTEYGVKVRFSVDHFEEPIYVDACVTIIDRRYSIPYHLELCRSKAVWHSGTIEIWIPVDLDQHDEVADVRFWSSGGKIYGAFVIGQRPG